MNLLHFHPKSHTPLVILAATAGLAILFDLLFFEKLPGISVPIFCAALVYVLLWLDATSHRRINVRAGILAALLLTFSAFFALRANPLLLVLDACVMAYIFTHLLVTLYGVSPAGKALLDYLLFPLTDIFLPALLSLDIFPQAFRKSPKESARIILGLVIALPITLVFLNLFVSADPLFASSISSLVGDLRLPTLVTHGIFIGAGTFGLTLLFAPAFWKTQVPKPESPQHEGLSMDLEAVVVFSVTNLLFLAFILIQATSLVGGEARLTELGLTYAEYARQGFFQLLFAGILVIGLMALARSVAFERYKEIGRFLQGTLVLQTLIILASSWTRLSAYEHAYGFTTLRVWSHAVLIAIGVILLFLLISLFYHMRHSVVLESMIAIMFATLIGLNVFNPDLFIATQNIARATKEHTEMNVPIDIPYLLFLSDDAAPAIGPFIDRLMEDPPYNNRMKQDETSSIHVFGHVYGSEEAFSEIFGAWMNRSAPTEWPSWNLARARAEKIREHVNKR